MSTTPNPALVAAAPALIALIGAIQTFETNMGPDPLAWQLKLPGSLTVLEGTVMLQLMQLGLAEIGAGETIINSKLGAWVTSLKALVPA